MTVDPALCRAIAVDLLIGRPLTADRVPQLLTQLTAAASLAERHAALEHELATLRASVVAAMSSAGPSEDERADGALNPTVVEGDFNLLSKECCP